MEFMPLHKTWNIQREREQSLVVKPPPKKLSHRSKLLEKVGNASLAFLSILNILENEL